MFVQLGLNSHRESLWGENVLTFHVVSILEQRENLSRITPGDQGAVFIFYIIHSDKRIIVVQEIISGGVIRKGMLMERVGISCTGASEQLMHLNVLVTFRHYVLSHHSGPCFVWFGFLLRLAMVDSLHSKRLWHLFRGFTDPFPFFLPRL